MNRGKGVDDLSSRKMLEGKGKFGMDKRNERDIKEVVCVVMCGSKQKSVKMCVCLGRNNHGI